MTPPAPAPDAAVTPVNPSSLAALRSLRDGEPALAKIWSNVGANDSTGVKAAGRGGDDDTLTSSWSSAAAAFDENGNVTGLDLGGRRLRSLPAEHLAKLTHLVTLNLGNTDLPAAAVRDAVVPFKDSLEVLSLGGNGINDSDAAEIGDIIRSCPKLHRLDLRYNDIGPGGARAISDAIFATCRGGGSSADNGDGSNNNGGCGGGPTVLHLEGNRIGDGGVASLASALVLPGWSISELFLGDNGIGPDGARHLAGAIADNSPDGGPSSLTNLFLEGNRIGPDGADALSAALEGRREGDDVLRHLFVDNNGIGKEGTQRLARALKSDGTIGGSLF